MGAMKWVVASLRTACPSPTSPQVTMPSANAPAAQSDAAGALRRSRSATIKPARLASSTGVCARMRLGSSLERVVSFIVYWYLPEGAARPFRPKQVLVLLPLWVVEIDLEPLNSTLQGIPASDTYSHPKSWKGHHRLRSKNSDHPCQRTISPTAPRGKSFHCQCMRSTRRDSPD